MSAKSVIALIIVGILVLWTLSNFLWNRKWRPWRQSKGIASPSFNDILRRTAKFVLSEDKEPFAKFPTIKKLNRKTMYLSLFILSLAICFTKNVPALKITPFVVLLILIAARVQKIFSARNATLTRMFQVATSEFKYARAADLNPWGYIKIKQWDSLTVPGETEVSIPAQWRADDPIKKDGFQNHFNSTVTDENTWIYKWDTAKGIVVCTPVSHIPTLADYPGSRKNEWNSIPLGVGANGEVCWLVDVAPHLLVCGTTGAGKSVTQRTLIFHCIQNPDRWRFLGIDLKRVELKPYAKYDDVVLGIARTLEDAVEVMRFARDEMMSRYEQMEEMGVDYFMKLEDPPYALMVMIDEAFMFMSPEGVKTDEGKIRDDLHGEATTLIGEVARLGRAAGIHLVLATQRPDAAVIKGEIKENLAARYAAGRMKSIASHMCLDSESATRIPGNIKGRAILSINGQEEFIQGYFAQQNWINEWLSEQGRTPGLQHTQEEEDTEETGERIQDPHLLVQIPDDFNDGKIEERFAYESEEDAAKRFNPFEVMETVDSQNVSKDPIPSPRLPSRDDPLPRPSSMPPRPVSSLPVSSLPDDITPVMKQVATVSKPPPVLPVNLDDEEFVNPLRMSRPNLIGGVSRAPRAEGAWDAGMDSIFVDIPQNTPDGSTPPPPRRPKRS